MLLFDINWLILEICISETEVIGNEELSFSVCKLIHHVLELLEIFHVLVVLEIGGNYCLAEGCDHEELLDC